MATELFADSSMAQSPIPEWHLSLKFFEQQSPTSCFSVLQGEQEVTNEIICIFKAMICSYIIVFSYIFHSFHLPEQDHEWLVPSVTGQGHTLDKMPVHHRSHILGTLYNQITQLTAGNPDTTAITCPSTLRAEYSPPSPTGLLTEPTCPELQSAGFISLLHPFIHDSHSFLMLASLLKQTYKKPK